MCISTLALMTFIDLLPPQIIDVQDGQINIAAEAGPVAWQKFEDVWCTTAPLKTASANSARVMSRDTTDTVEQE